MSRLAGKLPPADQIAMTRRGPSPSCEVYGDGDLEDWREVERRRIDKTWIEAQRAVDALLGITLPMHNDKFRYHWSRKCGHWTDEQRQAVLDA